MATYTTRGKALTEYLKPLGVENTYQLIPIDSLVKYADGTTKKILVK